MVRVVTSWGLEVVSAAGRSYKGFALRFASFFDVISSVSGMRPSLDISASALDELASESGAVAVSPLAENLVTRLFPAGAGAESSVFRRFGGILTT